MKKIIICIVFVMQVVMVWAQGTPSMKGKVLDAKTKTPLQNVLITSLKTKQSVATDGQGSFRFVNMGAGSQNIMISLSGYVSKTLTVEIKKDDVLDLGIIALEEDVTQELQISLVNLSENDLGDDNSGSEGTSGLLQASRDAFQQTAAFNWGNSRFRIRGLDGEYGLTMVNGVVMNKQIDGRPQFSNWGGLNDGTRNQEFTTGTTPSDYTFGNILGTQEINTRASYYRPGTRLSFSSSNTSYDGRTMITHASGFNKKGWAYMVSASNRWDNQLYFEGAKLSGTSIMASIEKKINDSHSINFTSVFAHTERGKTSANTAEVNDLKGFKYNSYWGWDSGKVRNSREKTVSEPFMILSHYWNINRKNTLQTNISYQTGVIGNTRLEYPFGNNPDPTYYKNLPSYYLNSTNAGDAAIAEQSKQAFMNGGQINWNYLKFANKNTRNGNSAYFLADQRNADDQLAANMFWTSEVNNHLILNTGVNYRQLKSHNYSMVKDLLGGNYALNYDNFLDGDRGSLDLNNKDGKLYEGDIFSYNYNLHSKVADAFMQAKFTFRKLDFYLGGQISQTKYQREGLFKNGNYENNSFGKGEEIKFDNFGAKAGFTFKATGNHLFSFNGAYLTKAPTMRNVFSNARYNDFVTENIDSEKIWSVDGNYVIRTPKLKARLTGYYNRIQNATDVSFYFAESINGDNSSDSDSFISEIVTGINKQNLGMELGLEYQISSTFKATAAVSYGEFTYTNNPNLKINVDGNASDTNVRPIIDMGQTYINGYRQAGMPQQAYSVGLEYRNANYWWIGANANYLAGTYVDLSYTLRSNNFTMNKTTGTSYPGITEEVVRNALKQEKLDNYMVFNLQGGKSWRVSHKNRNTIGFFASVNNVFDKLYRTGGFEQSRKTTYPDYTADNKNGTPSFGNKYFYGYGRSYMVNVYFNF